MDITMTISPFANFLVSQFNADRQSSNFEEVMEDATRTLEYLKKHNPAGYTELSQEFRHMNTLSKEEISRTLNSWNLTGYVMPNDMYEIGDRNARLQAFLHYLFAQLSRYLAPES